MSYHVYSYCHNYQRWYTHSSYYIDEIFCTVGCHPTRCSEFESTLNVTPCEYLEQLYQIASENVRNVVAIGEIGLGLYFIVVIRKTFNHMHDLSVPIHT